MAAFLTLGPTAAQAAEVQVPFDARGKVLVVDARLADRLGLFVAAHPGFSEARLYQLADSTYILEITRRVDKTQVRERLPLDAAGADSVRALVADRISAHAPSAQYDQEGRPLLTALSAVMGFGFYGWAVPYVFEISGEAAVATYMLTTAGTIVVPVLMTQNRNVAYPAVTLGFYGSTRGIVHGLLLTDAMNGGDDTDDEVALGAALGMSTAEAILGYALGTSMTPGQAHALALGGDLGLGYGWGTVELSERDENEGRAAVILGVTAAGLAGGYALGRFRDYSYGDVGIMRTAGVVGAYTGFAFTAGDESGDDAVVAASMAGSAIGLIVGDRIVNRAGYSFGQSINVDFMTLAGGLVGLSIATLIADEVDENDAVLRGVTAAGAIGGYAAGVSLQRRGGRPAKQSSLRLGFEPRWVASHDGGKMVPHVVAQLGLGPAR